MAKNYINNRDFTNTIAAWIEEDKRLKGECEDLEKYIRLAIPDYVAESFIKIVTGMASKRNFSGYTYIQDMKSEALEHCVKYADRFNIEKSQNAFAYFSQITFNAFIQLINKEKKYAGFKFELTRDSIENAHKFDRNLITSSVEKKK